MNFANKNSCYDFVKTTLRVAQSHGIEIPSMAMDMARDDRSLDLVTEHYHGRDAVGDVSRWEFWSRSTISPLFTAPHTLLLFVRFITPRHWKLPLRLSRKQKISTSSILLVCTERIKFSFIHIATGDALLNKHTSYIFHYFTTFPTDLLTFPSFIHRFVNPKKRPAKRERVPCTATHHGRRSFGFAPEL